VASNLGCQQSLTLLVQCSHRSHDETSVVRCSTERTLGTSVASRADKAADSDKSSSFIRNAEARRSIAVPAMKPHSGYIWHTSSTDDSPHRESLKGCLHIPPTRGIALGAKPPGTTVDPTTEVLPHTRPSKTTAQVESLGGNQPRPVAGCILDDTLTPPWPSPRILGSCPTVRIRTGKATKLNPPDQSPLACAWLVHGALSLVPWSLSLSLSRISFHTCCNVFRSPTADFSNDIKQPTKEAK